MSIYLLRAPLSLATASYDAAAGAMIYRSKMQAGLKRNFQMMSGAAWSRRTPRVPIMPLTIGALFLSGVFVLCPGMFVERRSRT